MRQRGGGKGESQSQSLEKVLAGQPEEEKAAPRGTGVRFRAVAVIAGVGF